jgi:imidazolonepropionase-like amidohydrolase
MTIIVTGNKITAVEKGYRNSASSDDMLIDLKDKTVLPGLIDLHVHLELQMSPSVYIEKFTSNPADTAFRSVNYASVTLLVGFTTVRDLGGTGVNLPILLPLMTILQKYKNIGKCYICNERRDCLQELIIR